MGRSRANSRRYIFRRHATTDQVCECGASFKAYFLAEEGQQYMKPLWLCTRDACDNSLPKTAEILRAEIKES